jgi:hypothetical protein
MFYFVICSATTMFILCFINCGSLKIKIPCM